LLLYFLQHLTTSLATIFLFVSPESLSSLFFFNLSFSIVTMATRNPIILDKPEDWPIWIEEIRGSIPDETWILIDPDVDAHEDFMRKPSEPRPQEVNPAKTSYVELTAVERNVHDQLFRHYQVALKQYERETATSASKGFISYQAAQKYEASIRKAPTTTTVSKWLTTWEQAMAEAIKYDIPEINAGRWLRDIARAMKPLSDALYVKFINAATNDAKSGPERYLEVSMKIREIIQTDVSKRTVMRGTAFAAEFDGEPAPYGDNCDNHDERKNTKSHKRARTTSAPNNVTKGKKRKISCKACGQPSHRLIRCYYAFPELRPLDFEPDEELVEKVARALEDGGLTKEVNTIRKERRNKQ
jgi:hypothetical protein